MEWRPAWTTENYALRNKAREAGKKREGRKEKKREEKNGRKGDPGWPTCLACHKISVPRYRMAERLSLDALRFPSFQSFELNKFPLVPPCQIPSYSNRKQAKPASDPSALE